MFDRPVVYVDIETTGGSYRNSRVLEVAAIRVENGKVVDTFETLLDPQTSVPRFITGITGITNQDIVGMPTFAEIAKDLYSFMEDAIFIAHNVRFDFSFLKNEFALCGISFNPQLLCTVRLSRSLYSDQKGHSLEKLIERHSIPINDRHRALEDALAIQYFAELAYKEKGNELFSAAVQKQIKTKYMPPNLDLEKIKDVKNEPGVYIFKDKIGQPLYVGKSIHLKKRIIDHFQDTSSKELKISQNVHDIETIPTQTELAALLLESKLVKQLQPLFNIRLRRIKKYTLLVEHLNDDGYATVSVESGELNYESDFSKVIGVYDSRMKAKARLDLFTRTHDLCPKLMGLEKTKGVCFWYTLSRCKGACAGKEDRENYNERLAIATEKNRLQNWPYDGPIRIPVQEGVDEIVIHNWMIEGGSLESEVQFDIDEYKIIRRFIRENQHLIEQS